MRETRPAAVAGVFYPADPIALDAAARAHFPVRHAPPTRVPALVVPHAGHVYSGRIAAAVLGETIVPPTVVVLAPNHTGAGHAGAGAMLRAADYATPLGRVALDDALAARLLAEAPTLLADDSAAHAREHAIEVILPFLQVLRADVRLVPVVLAWDSWEPARELGAALHRAVGARDDVLVIASSDGNHYESAAVTGEKDRHALAALEALDGEGLLLACEAHAVSMCGRGPAAAACAFARLRGGRRGRVVAWSHSGMVNGDLARVVGYAGVRLGEQEEATVDA
jgi:AmmeMemoRadiSam system protein B